MTDTPVGPLRLHVKGFQGPQPLDVWDRDGEEQLVLTQEPVSKIPKKIKDEGRARTGTYTVKYSG